MNMNTYSYILTAILTTDNIGNSAVDHEIQDFILAENIKDAYLQLLAIVNNLNNLSSTYIWTIKTLQHSYFVGINSGIVCKYEKAINNDKCNCSCDCNEESSNDDDVKCDCCK